MKRIVFVFLLCLAGSASAQRITREKIVNRQYYKDYVWALYSSTGSLLISSGVYTTGPSNYSHYFQEVSRQLDSLGSGPTTPFSQWLGQATIQVPGKGYAMTATVISPNWPTDHTDFAFYRYGNPLAAPRLIHSQDLDSGKDDYTTDLQPATNGYFISALTGSQPPRKQFRLIKTDTTGLILWQKTYGISVNDFIANMRTTADGNLLLAGQSSPPPSGETKLRMLLVNQQGDSLASLLYAYPQPLGPNATLQAGGALQDRLLALRGGGFAMLAQIDTSNTGSIITNTYPLVLKVNRRLQPQWQYTYRAKPLFGVTRNMFFAGACELQDSSLLVLATNQNGNTGHNNPFYLLRLDGHTGQLLTTYQLLSNLCAQFHATKLLPDGDSALFVLGTCGDATRRGTYAAHISLKNMPKVVLATAAPAQPVAKQLHLDTIYPNPADEAATLTYRCPAGVTGAGTLLVRDVLGQEVQRAVVPASSSGSLRLPLGSLASGLYVCELKWPGQVSATRKLLVSH